MIKTGKAPLTVMTFLAIMSISLVVNLPGLAVTPMLGTLSKVFPDSTQLEKQLLTILPNLLIIPFVLLSGRLSLARHKMPIIIGALVLFCASAVWYLFASSMTQLIIISCLIGIGAGLLIPFSTGLIADSFAGSYRMNVMGLQSGISNSVLVIATFVVGWLSHSGNWHVPFAVYLVGLIPLVMCIWLRNAPDMQPDCAPQTSDSSTTAEVAAITSGEKSHNGFYVGKIVSLIAVYFIITFTTITISYYCPFLIEKKDWNSDLTGTITAVYFLFILLPGYQLPLIVRLLRGYTFIFSGVIAMLGLALFAFYPGTVTMIIGAACAGLGYGICQPMLYDKASVAVSNPCKSTLSLALVLAANYLAIVVAPFAIDGLRSMFHAAGVPTFAFIVGFVILVAFSAASIIFRHTFAFNVNKKYYQK